MLSLKTSVYFNREQTQGIGMARLTNRFFLSHHSCHSTIINNPVFDMYHERTHPE